MALPVEQDYLLGYSESEFNRLIRQSAFFGDLTEHTLRTAGLTTGMRVLDIGCGVGDVSFLAASLVGPNGSVVGVDRNPDTVQVAMGRKAKAGLQHVSFEVGDVLNLAYRQEFDAVIGRLVLLYLGDQVQAMRAFASYTKQGGLIYFQELVRPGIFTVPTVPLWDRVIALIEQAASIGKIDLYTGLRLPQLMRAAGLPQPTMLGMARIEGGPDSRAYVYAAETLRSLVPVLERAGVATAESLGIETLAERLRADVVAADATVHLPILNAGWTRTV